jgi:hypothetical protein
MVDDQVAPITTSASAGNAFLNIVIRDNSDDSEYSGLWSELDHKFNHQFLFRDS